VTCVAFHPLEDRYFVSGSFDKKLRIWNIPEHRVVEWAQTANIITACCFSPSGNMAVAGLYNGQCVFYQTEGLKYFTQLDARNRSGKNRKGKKVTGLVFAPDGKHLLVTTNDSRLRLYDMDDYSCKMKYKGLTNDELQIRAAFSQDGRHIICGSENQCVYIWETSSTTPGATPTVPVPAGTKKKKTRSESYEYFKGNSTTVTCAQYVPRSSIVLTSENAGEASRIFHLILASGYNGELKFFENRGRPKDT
jgi:WD40 repeat protein